MTYVTIVVKKHSPGTHLGTRASQVRGEKNVVTKSQRKADDFLVAF
jgi:hypothetical protein